MSRRGDARLTWLTCAVDRVDHAITDEDLVRGSGSYRALCGATVWAASLASPPAGRCGTCDENLRPTADAGPARNPERNRRWSRWTPPGPA